MSHLLRRRRGHDSEDEDEEESIVSGMTTTDYDEDDSQQEDDETDSEYDSGEQDADAEQEQEDGPQQDEVEQQQPAVVETEAKVVQQATTTPPTTTSSQATENKGQVNDQPKSPPPVTATTTASSETVVMDYQDLQQQEKEKTVQELREYRRKLAEDPSFVPYVGLFWGHDDRYRQDSLATGGNEATRESMPPQFSQHTPSSASIKKASYDRNLDPLMHKKWDHSGYEELMRLEEQEERRKREVIESGESPCSQVDQHHQYKPPPRLPRHHHYNNHNQSGRGRGSGGNSHRGGYHHPQNRFGNSQKRPFTQQQQEWPQLTAGGSTRGQSISDNNSKAQEQPKVDAWGSVNRAQEIKPIVNVDVVADRWGASTTTAADDNNGWGTSVSTTAATAANDGWGPAPTNDTPQAETQLVDTKQEAPKQDASNTSSVQAEHGWGALPEAASTTAKPKQQQQQQEPESSETAVTDDWKTSPPVTMTTHTEPSSSTGWGEQPTATLNQGWNTVPESKDASNWTQTVDVEITTELPAATTEPKATDHNKVDTQQEKEKPSTCNTPAAAATDDGWGKPQETQDTTWSSSNETKDADTPQWESTTANNTPHQTNGKSKSTSSSQAAAKHNDIPLEEKASSSWANVQPDVQVHTTPSDFSKIDYSRRYDPSRRKHNSTWQHSQPHAEEKEDYNTKAVQDDSFTQQQQQDQTTPSDTWGADTATTTTPPHAAGWNTFEDANVQNGRTTENASTPSPPKSKETTQADASWDSKPVAKSTALSWNAAPEATKPTTHWNESSFAATATGAFDQSNSSSSSSMRGGGSGWKNSRSSNSTNWNADREWNNKKRNEQQSKKSRGYFSGKNTTVDMHVAAETTSNSTEGFGTPETSAWGHFQSTGDDDSDVEIILEAEEEPEWSKDDEQVLGMTAPADTEQQPQQDSPSSSSHRMTKPHLSQHQHDSGISSPRPEYDRKPVAVNGGRHGNHNNKPPHARPYDENWRQPREEADPYRPMYYPAPVAHHPTYMPMIPNGNGNPMYAMSYPMGDPTSSSSSSSPSNMVARNGGGGGGGGGSGGRSASPLHEPSSSTSPRKFYTPSPPNVQQLPPGYEANGMVYYGMDPSAMYPPPQAFYYYAPPSLPQTQSPHMMANNHNTMPALHHLQQAEEDGWGPVPDTAEVEEQWRSTTVNKSSQHDFQNRKQQQPVDQYYYTSPNHHY